MGIKLAVSLVSLHTQYFLRFFFSFKAAPFIMVQYTVPTDLMSRRHPKGFQTKTISKTRSTKSQHAPLKLDTLLTELLFEILDWMELKDALRFRLVSRRFAELVLLAPSILKRALRHIKAPLPYSPKPIQSLSGKETISLCRRAFALEENWKRKLDRVKSKSFFALHRPYHLALAPGGRYLISAYHSTSGSEQYVGLYDLENPYGTALIASCPTRSPIDSLTVTWIVNKGRQGIAIAWVRELPFEKRATKVAGTEVVVLFISLEDIEALTNPHHGRKESPFEVLFSRQWKVGAIRLSLANDTLAVARSPGTLTFYNLEDGRRSAIELPDLPHSTMSDPVIFATKLLCDGTALVIRGESGHSQTLNLHAIEAYQIPLWGTMHQAPMPLQCNYVHANQTNYTISEMYRRQPTCDNPSEEEIAEANGYYPAVTICVESSEPNRGITQYRLYPTREPETKESEARFSYIWPVTVWQGHYSEHDAFRTRTRSLAGADRSLGFPYTAPGRALTPTLGEFMVLSSFGEDNIPSVALPQPLESDIIQCVAWDESSGKLVLSTAGDLKVWVLDFAV